MSPCTSNENCRRSSDSAPGAIYDCPLTATRPLRVIGARGSRSWHTGAAVVNRPLAGEWYGYLGEHRTPGDRV